MELIELTSKEKIETVMTLCKESFHSDAVKEKEKINNLSRKFNKCGKVFALTNEFKVLVGFIAFYCNDIQTKAAYLSMIVVKKEFQGMGYGKILLDKLFKTAREYGFKSIELEVAKDNTKAIKFYTNKNFYIKKENGDSLFLKCDI